MGIKIDIKEIVKLKEQGMSERAIRDELNKKGIKVSHSKVHEELVKYYGKNCIPGPKRKLDDNIKDIYEFKEQGMSYEEIKDELNKKGIQISLRHLERVIKKYYKEIGKDVPRADSNKIKLDIEELLRLRNQGMSEVLITKHMNDKGISVSCTTINKRLNDYYKKMGMVKTKPRLEIPNIEEVVAMKKQGMSSIAIQKVLNDRGLKISLTTLDKRLNEYYEKTGEKKAPPNRYTIQIPNIEEIVDFKEQGMTYNFLIEYLKEKGIVLSSGTLSRRIKEYYEKSGKEKKAARNKKIEIDNIEEIIKLKEQGMTNKELTEYLNKKGINILYGIVNKRIKEYYEKIKQENVVDEIINNPIKEILMSGMTIEEITSEYKEINEQKIRKDLAKLRVTAQYSKKENGKTISDDDFIEVIDILDNTEEKMNKYKKWLNYYAKDGECPKGKIDLIRDNIFENNVDLMVYIMTRLGIDFQKGYDMRVFEMYKESYKQKIEKYLGRMESVEKSIKQKNKNKNKNNHEER